jgi:hypothetical protein
MTTTDFDPWSDALKVEGLYGSRWLEACIDHDPGWAMTDGAVEQLAGLTLANKAEWMRCREVLRGAKQLQVVEKAIKRYLGQVGDKDPVIALKFDRVSTLYPKAPVGADDEVPQRWDMTPGGSAALWHIAPSGNIPVAYAPLVVSATLVDVGTGQVSLELAWLCRGRWVKGVVPRETAKQPNELVKALGGHEGFPGDSNNARLLVKYLTDYEHHNEERLRRKHTTQQMGWVEGGEQGFIIGEDHVRHKSRKRIQYVGPGGAGGHQLRRAVSTRGTIEGWLEGIRVVGQYPLVELAVYAAVAPVLLEILSARNFCMDWAQKTGTGKSTALSVAASVWGRCDPNAADSFISSWDVKQVGLERRATAFNGLPLILDDTKTAKSWGGRSEVPGIVYRVVDGQGRVRGARQGIDETRYWRTVLLASGEQRLIDFSKDGGTAGRTLSLWALPFGGKSAKIASDIREIEGLLFEHYGHVGPLVVRWLVQNKDLWPSIQEEHRGLSVTFRDRLAEACPGGSMDLAVLDRVGKSLSIVHLAAKLVHKAVGMPWEMGDPVGPAVELVARGAGGVDRELEALKYVVSWAAQNRKSFLHSEEQRKRQDPPHGGWLGFWEAEVSTVGWRVLALFPRTLSKFLKDEGFEPRSTYQRWMEEGWLVTTEKGRATARLGDLDGRPRLVQIRREAVETHGDLTGDGQTELPI